MSSSLYLPTGYRENPPASSDSFGDYWDDTELRTADQWQAPVYRVAAEIVAGKVVVDIGCGTGGKLARYAMPVAKRCVGIDQASGIAAARRNYPDGEWIEGDLALDETWSLARNLAPEVVICSDVIEHVPDPRELLGRLRDLGGQLVISTPDRDYLPDSTPSGPPTNALHIREWSASEFTMLLEDEGFRILGVRHLPPRADMPLLLSAKMLAWRLTHGRGVQMPRSSMAFICEVDG